MKNKTSKIFTIIFALLCSFAITTSVKAAAAPDFYIVLKGEPGADNGGYKVHQKYDDWTFCIDKGSWYKATYSNGLGLTEAEKENVIANKYNYNPGDKTQTFCTVDESKDENYDSSPPWISSDENPIISMEYGGKRKCRTNI